MKFIKSSLSGIELNYCYIKNPADVPEALNIINRMSRIGFDIETTGLDPHKDKSVLLQLGDIHKQFLFDMRYGIHITMFKNLLEGPKPKVGVNLAFDINFCKPHLDIDTNIFDTMLLRQIELAGTFKGKGIISMEAQALHYFGIKLDKSIGITFTDTKLKDLSTKQLEYSTLDVIIPLMILDKQIPILESEGLIPTAKLEMEVLPSCADIAYNGFYLDQKKWENLMVKSRKIQKEVKQYLDDYFSQFIQIDLMGNPLINYSSGAQLLFGLQRAGFDIEDTKATTMRFLSDSNLSKHILQYKGLDAVLTKFGRNYINFINEVTKRVHPKVWQIGNRSGRISQSNPNLQQIVGKDITPEFSGKQYRYAFTAQNGGWIINPDFSGQEALILTEITKEQRWIDCINRGNQIHVMAAQDVFGEKVKKGDPLYTIIKNMNFGKVYGMTFYRLQKQYKELGITIELDKCEEYMNKHEEIYPAIPKKLKEISIRALETGYATTLNGRKRKFNVPRWKLIYSKRRNQDIVVPIAYNDEESKTILHAIMRESANHSVQGSAADMLKIAMTLQRKKLKEDGLLKSFLLSNTVHDEDVFEYTKNDSKEEVMELSQKYIVNPMLEAGSRFLKVVEPAVETHIGRTWSK